MADTTEGKVQDLTSSIRTIRITGFLVALACILIVSFVFENSPATFRLCTVLILITYGGVLLWGQRRMENGFRNILSDRAAAEAQVDQFLSAFKTVMADIRDGDFTTSLEPLRRHAQYAEIATTMESTTQSFAATLKKIQKASAEVSSQAHKILETSGDQASGSSEQAAAVAEITSAMEELARTAAQIAENTAWVVGSSEDAEARATEGMSAMQKSTGNLERMNERMSEINENTHHLGEKFQEIDKILTLITNIAAETHILALNAAIEAASAGEYGARFSVIATEVRRLSDMSQESVDEIKKILGDFQRSIHSTILATEHGTKEFEAAMEGAFLVQEKLGSIVEKVGQTTRAAKEISLATQQQKTASDQIVETLKDVSTVIRQIANALQEFKVTANRLNMLAMEMQLISQSFTIEAEHNIKFLARHASETTEIREFKRQNAAPALQEILQQTRFIEFLYIVDLEGNMITFAMAEHLKSEASMNLLTSSANYSQRPWFYTALESGRPYITSMYKSSLTGEDCFTISTPIRNSDGATMGVLGIDVNASTWSRLE